MVCRLLEVRYFDKAASYGTMSPQIREIVRLRFVVAFLGEREQAGWWPSNFLSRNARAFMEPVFGNGCTLAQYLGATEAARRVHDDRIGVGRVFHLFRMPETVERLIFECLADKSVSEEVGDCISSGSIGQSVLVQLTPNIGRTETGPVRIGNIEMVGEPDSMAAVAAHYQAALTAHTQCFPYFSEHR
jgi:hypothetical protein